jgi:hypothetical protein
MRCWRGLADLRCSEVELAPSVSSLTKDGIMHDYIDGQVLCEQDIHLHKSRNTQIAQLYVYFLNMVSSANLHFTVFAEWALCIICIFHLNTVCPSHMGQQKWLDNLIRYWPVDLGLDWGNAFVCRRTRGALQAIKSTIPFWNACCTAVFTSISGCWGLLRAIV